MRPIERAPIPRVSGEALRGGIESMREERAAQRPRYDLGMSKPQIGSIRGANDPKREPFSEDRLPRSRFAVEQARLEIARSAGGVGVCVAAMGEQRPDGGARGVGASG